MEIYMFDILIFGMGFIFGYFIKNIPVVKKFLREQFIKREVVKILKDRPEDGKIPAIKKYRDLKRFDPGPYPPTLTEAKKYVDSLEFKMKLKKIALPGR